LLFFQKTRAFFLLPAPWALLLTPAPAWGMCPPPIGVLTRTPSQQGRVMKIRNSLRAAKTRDKNCRVVRRHGRVYVINKKNPRMKARQG